MTRKKKHYMMTLMFEDGTEVFDFYSSEKIEDGEHSPFLDLIMIDYLEESGYDIKSELPIDYVVDSYENWCFMQDILEQEEIIMIMEEAEDKEWGCFSY